MESDSESEAGPGAGAGAGAAEDEGEDEGAGFGAKTGAADDSASGAGAGAGAGAGDGEGEGAAEVFGETAEAEAWEGSDALVALTVEATLEGRGDCEAEAEADTADDDGAEEEEEELVEFSKKHWNSWLLYPHSPPGHPPERPIMSAPIQRHDSGTYSHQWEERWTKGSRRGSRIH